MYLKTENLAVPHPVDETAFFRETLKSELRNARENRRVPTRIVLTSAEFVRHLSLFTQIPQSRSKSLYSFDGVEIEIEGELRQIVKSLNDCGNPQRKPE